MNEYVLDASAVLALLNEEAGKERVEAVLPGSVMSAVNCCEVLGKLLDAGMAEGEEEESIGLLNVRVVSFDLESARLAAGLRPKTRVLGLSFGDRSRLALGLARKGTVVTADKAWAKLELGIKIEVVR